jgi:GH25 family lysozyme M1 (1,4-beta-N-acetylmuramidase)
MLSSLSLLVFLHYDYRVLIYIRTVHGHDDTRYQYTSSGWIAQYRNNHTQWSDKRMIKGDGYKDLF